MPDVRRRATLGFGSIALGLSIASGLALAATSASDPGVVWLLFAATAVAGVVFFTGAAYASAVRFQDQATSAAAKLRGRSETTSEESDASPSQPPTSQSHADDAADEVDYLMALRHEFRTPLNAMLGFCDVLLDGIDGEINEAQKEDLEIIRASGLRLRTLFDNAFDLSQLEAGELRMDNESVDVETPLQRALTETELLWGGKRNIVFDRPDSSCRVTGDEPRLRRVLLTLCDFLVGEFRDADLAVNLLRKEEHVDVVIRASTTQSLALGSIPTAADVLSADESEQMRLWSIAVASEVVALHGGSIAYRESPPEIVVQLPADGSG